MVIRRPKLDVKVSRFFEAIICSFTNAACFLSPDIQFQELCSSAYS